MCILYNYTNITVMDVIFFSAYCIFHILESKRCEHITSSYASSFILTSEGEVCTCVYKYVCASKCETVSGLYDFCVFCLC